jgi:hypothetical protein
MIRTHISQTLLLGILFCIAFASCTNIYYVGKTTEPLRVYYEPDTTSLVTYTIPIGSKVLTKK